MRMLTQTQKRAAWSPGCRRDRLAAYRFGGGVALIDPRCFIALVMLSRILRRHDRAPRDFDTWSYACRPVRRGTALSMHSYGIAVDVRATSFPLGVQVRDEQLLATAADVAQLVTPDGWRVWEWGGNWRRPDGMHWEIAAPPASLATFSLPRDRSQFEDPSRLSAWPEHLELSESCGA